MRQTDEGALRWRGQRSTRHLGRRLLILYAITAATVAAVFSVALLLNWTSMLEFGTTTDRVAHVYRDLSSLQASERNSNLRLLTYLTAGDATTLSQYRASVGTRELALAQLSMSARDETSAMALNTLKSEFGVLDAVAERCIASRAAGDELGALQQWRERSEPTLTAIERQFVTIAQVQETAQATARQDGQRTLLITLFLTFLFATATALLGLWLVRRVILSITRPLEALAKAAAAIGAGQLETRVAGGLAAEFAMLGGVMNTMATHLAESRDELQTALDATERRNQELHLLSAVGGALDSSLDLDLIVERSLGVIFTAFEFQGGAIVLYDDMREHWRWYDREGQDTTAIREAAQSAAQRLARRLLPGGAHAIATYSLVDESPQERTILILSLDTAARPQGFLTLIAEGAWSPDERQRNLLEQVGGQIARAIENARLYVAEKGRSAEAGMLAQMAQLTTGTLDPDRLVQLIARYAVQVLGVDRCIVGFFAMRTDTGEDHTLQRLYQYGFQPQQTPLGMRERAGLQKIVRRHMLNGQLLIVTDAARDVRPEVRELAASLHTSSFISVPLIAHERPLGMIYLDTHAPRQHSFQTQDQRILTAIADQAAAALDGARLYEAERRRGAQLRLLNRTSQQIVALPHLDDLFAAVIATLKQTLGCKAARIGLLDMGEFRFTSRSADNGQQADDGVQAELADLLWVLEHNAPRRFTRHNGAPNMTAGLLTPLATSGGVIGVLEVVVAVEDGDAFDTEDERTLLALGDQLGMAVERSRLQERALSLAVVEERNRLARDLHDSVTQSLFSMNLTIEATRLLLDRDTAAAALQLAQLRERTRQTLAEMRDLIHSLRPAELSEQGLVVALRRWGERVRHEHLLPVEVRVEGLTPVRLTELQERELFRIAQEALNNAIKHAAATRVTIRLYSSPDEVALLIEDDGKGFDPTVPPRSDAFGMRGMYERAALIGGTLTVDSDPAGGTRVLVTIAGPAKPGGHPSPSRQPTGAVRSLARYDANR